MKKDVIVAFVCLLGSIVLFLLLGTIQEERAKRFPEVLIIVMGILSAIFLIQAVLKRQLKKAATQGFPWGRFFILFGMIVVYFAVMQSIGFYLSTFLFFVAVTIGLGHADLTTSKALIRIFQSAVFTAILFVLFKVFLEVQTPRGILF